MCWKLSQAVYISYELRYLCCCPCNGGSGLCEGNVFFLVVLCDQKSKLKLTAKK